uniref:Uncharacterized protein n=1 Tax=Rhizophora mucronata TaxID=61149 RepID=A0A2P2J1R1_RHIMU
MALTLIMYLSPMKLLNFRFP